ncbi:MAG: hypothetical protein ACRDS9_16520 [Pseudonocardiaceae bacterium]
MTLTVVAVARYWKVRGMGSPEEKDALNVVGTSVQLAFGGVEAI